MTVTTVEIAEPQRDHRGKLRSLYQTVNDEPSLTVQSDGPKADIHFILKQYEQVGGLEANLDAAEIKYMDISEFTDYKDALGHAMMAEADFLTLPSKVREIFNHDVAEWLDTAHDPEKRDALVKAGFLKAVVEGPEKDRPPEVDPELKKEPGERGEASKVDVIPAAAE